MFGFSTKSEIALDDALRAAGLPATELLVSSPAALDFIFPATATHFGGNPYFEPGGEWPRSRLDGRPYDFICQVNLRNCPDRPEVPFDLFSVFLCWDMLENETEDQFRACQVRTYRNASNERAITLARPDSAAASDYRVRACPVTTRRLMTYPDSPTDKHPEIQTALSRFRNPRAAYDRALKRLGARHRDRSHVGGYPAWVHMDNFDHDNDLVFLAQIEYHVDAKNCIYDAAPIYIAVSRADPTRIDIDYTQTQ